MAWGAIPNAIQPKQRRPLPIPRGSMDGGSFVMLTFLRLAQRCGETTRSSTTITAIVSRHPHRVKDGVLSHFSTPKGADWPRFACVFVRPGMGIIGVVLLGRVSSKKLEEDLLCHELSRWFEERTHFKAISFGGGVLRAVARDWRTQDLFGGRPQPQACCYRLGLGQAPAERTTTSIERRIFPLTPAATESYSASHVSGAKPARMARRDRNHVAPIFHGCPDEDLSCKSMRGPVAYILGL